MKNKIYITIILMWISIPWNTASAQQSRPALEEISEENRATNWVHYKKELNLTPEQLFTTHRKSLGLNAGDEMRMIQEYTSPVTGIVQRRFQQFYNGIKVHGAVTNVYSLDGVVIKSNGRIIENLQPTVPVINEASALDAALAEVPSENYKWNNAKAEKRLKLKKKSSIATYFPHGELIYMYRKGSAKKTFSDFELTWKFPINVDRGNSKYVFVSAISGNIINTLPINISCSPASLTLPFNGVQTIYTSVQGRCDNSLEYELFDDCEVDLKVENDGYGTGDDDPICNFGGDNNWGSGTLPLPGFFGDGTQVLWGMRKVFEFYKNNYTWNSYNNANGSIDCTVMFEFEDDNGQPTGNNAQYNDVEEDFDFGYGPDGSDETDSYTTLDIVGHEFTHGVDDFCADLDYSDESGALDESFADIFGETIEQSTHLGPVINAWLIGEDRGNPIRSFFNPNDYGDPDTYQGTNWCNFNNSSLSCTEDDQGGVHINSGVQNYFFYLLTEGGTGTNDHGVNFSVSGIGLSDAAAIAFSAHLYLFGTAEFNDSRDAWLEAANDIFGNCSNQAIQVGKAWHAVGVGAQTSDYNEMVTGVVTANVANTTREAVNQIFTAGPTIINSNSGGAEVRFYAGNEILLLPGFEAESGTAFLARINPCSITIHAAPRIESLISQMNNANTSSTSARKIEHFKVFPNPYSNEFTVEFKPRDNEVAQKIKILNSNGNVIQEENVYSENGDFSATIQTEGLADAIYFVQIITNQRSLMMKTSKISK